MAVIEGTRALKSWKGEYDFAVDGGAIGTITLRSDDGPIPNGAIVTHGLVEVDTGFTTGSAATGAVQVEGAGDIVAAAVVSGAPWSTTGRKSIIPVATGATTVKTSAARSPAFVIAVGTVTAGKMRVILYYR